MSEDLGEFQTQRDKKQARSPAADSLTVCQEGVCCAQINCENNSFSLAPASLLLEL
jgi:hypothetical protein